MEQGRLQSAESVSVAACATVIGPSAVIVWLTVGSSGEAESVAPSLCHAATISEPPALRSVQSAAIDAAVALGLFGWRKKRKALNRIGVGQIDPSL
jgi:hypothetical protein